MALDKNRLEFELSVNDDPFRQTMRRMGAESARYSKSISNSLSDAGVGAEKLQDSLESVEFQKVAEEAKRTSLAVTKSFDKAGADLKKAFKDADAGLEIPAGFEKAKAAVSKFSSSAKADLTKVDQAVSDLTQEVGSLGSQIQAVSFASLANGASSVAEDVSALGDTFRQAGEEMRLTEQQLHKIFTKPEDVAKYSAAIREIKSQFEGLSGEDLVEGIEVLERFGMTGEKQLKRVTNAAQVAKKGVSDIAEPYAEFMATSAKGGDFGALEELRVLLGVGGEELKKFGAEVDASNKVLGDTPEQWAKAKVALDKYLDTASRYQDVSSRSQDSIAKLNTEIDKFNTSVGSGTGTVKSYVAEGLLPLVQKLNNASEETKTFLGVFAEGTGVLATGVAKMAEVGAYSAVAVNSLKGLTAAMTAAQLATATMVATTGAFVIGGAAAVAGIGLIIKSAYDMAKAWREATKAHESYLETQRRALDENSDRGRLAKLSIKDILDEANAIEDAGERRVLVSNAIIGKEAEAAIAREKGNTKLANALESEAKALRGSRAEYDARSSAAEGAEKRKTKAVEDGTKASATAYKVDAEAHAKAQQQKADDAQRSADIRAKAEERVRQLNQEDDSLKRSSIALDRQALDSTAAQIAALEAKLEKGQDVTAELERELKGRAENEKRLINAEAALDRIAIKQRAASDAAADPANAQRILDQAAERERQLNQRVGMDRQRIDQQTAKEQQAAQDKLAAASKKRADDEAAAKQKALDIAAQTADLDLRASEQTRQAQESAFQERRSQLEEEAAIGRDVRAEMAKLDEEQAKARKAAIDEETQLTVQAIKKRADAEKAGKSDAEKQLIDRRAALDVEKAIMDCKTQTGQIVNQSLALYKQETAELIKQRDVLIEQNKERDKAKKGFDSTIQGGAQSVEEAFGSNASGWGVSKRKRKATDENGRTVEDYDREISRRRGNITNREASSRAGQVGTGPGLSSPLGVSGKDGLSTGGSSGEISLSGDPLKVSADRLDKIHKLILAATDPKDGSQDSAQAGSTNTGIGGIPSSDGGEFSSGFGQKRSEREAAKEEQASGAGDTRSAPPAALNIDSLTQAMSSVVTEVQGLRADLKQLTSLASRQVNNGVRDIGRHVPNPYLS